MCKINVQDNLYFDEPIKLVARLKNAVRNDEVTIAQVMDFIRTEKNTTFYFDEKMKLVEKGSSDATFVWLDTGLITEDRRPILVSIRLGNGSDIFVGHIAGSASYLFDKLRELNPSFKKQINTNSRFFYTKYNLSVRERKLQHLEIKAKKNYTWINYEEMSGSEVLRGEYEMFADIEPIAVGAEEISVSDPVARPVPFKENKEKKNDLGELSQIQYEKIAEDLKELMLVNRWHSQYGIVRYLRMIAFRLEKLIEEGRSEYYILNPIRSAIVNTGLIDRFGSPIHILYQKNLKEKTYEPKLIMEGKRDYLYNRFEKEDINKKILPISFCEPNERVLPVGLEDIDITQKALIHVIEERRDRFPSEYADMPSMTLAVKVREAIEFAFHINEIDHHFIRPLYSTTHQTIIWVVPMFKDNDIRREPGLVLYLREADEGFYELKTVLPYDEEMKDKLVSMELYRNIW